jgi:hypothetical protein
LIDLQDARIRRARFDKAAGIVTIEIVLAGGKPASLVFEGVHASPHIAEMLKLGGLVLDWKPSAGPGNTHIYLLDGVITLRADKLSVK